MIPEVKTFLDEFFQAELVAHNAYMKPDLEKSNAAANYMYSFCSEALFNQFTPTVQKELDDDPMLYDDFGDYKYPRFLFKLSQYKHKEHGDLYLAYVTSATLPYDDDLAIDHCLFVKHTDNGYKIIGINFVYPENLKNIHWRVGIGEGISIETAGKFIDIERYTEPQFDKINHEISQFSIDEYHKDR